MVDDELEKKILAQAPIEWQRFQQIKEKRSKGKSKMQRDLEDIERKANSLRREHMMDPHLREIDAKMKERIKPESASKLFCPNCGDGDHKNRMNNQPWCIKCNTALVPRKKQKKGRREPEVRPVRNAMRRELDRLNPGLNPKNEEKES